MHKIAIASVMLLLVISAASCQPLSPAITRMGNGLTVVLQEDHSAELVGIDVWVKAGSRFETPKNSGVAHFIEHLLFGTTQKRKSGDMDREMESLGATLDAHTTSDYAHFSTTVSSRYLNKALDVFADAVNNSLFREEDIAQERSVILDEIARKQTDPAAVCRDLLAKNIYSDSPYSLPFEGTRESVTAITRDDILDFYHKYYVPSNMAIVLVGDFDKLNAVSEVGRLFQGVASAAPADKTSTPSKLAKQVTITAKASYESNYLGIGFLGPPASEFGDVCATDVLLTYLGIGYGSWLSGELKTKLAIVGDGTADFVTQHGPGLISIIVSAPSANITKAKDAIFAKIESIKTQGLSQVDIDRAKRSLLGQAAFQDETVGGLASTIGFYFAVSDAEFAGKYAASVQSVTGDDIQRVARKYLDPNAAAVVTIGPDQEGSK